MTHRDEMEQRELAIHLFRDRIDELNREIEQLKEDMDKHLPHNRLVKADILEILWEGDADEYTLEE